MEDEDIKIVEDLKNKWELNAFGDMSNVLSLNEIKAIENLLSRLKTAERMNDVLAKYIVIHDKNLSETFCEDKDDVQCVTRYTLGNCDYCIKEWARKKV